MGSLGEGDAKSGVLNSLTYVSPAEMGLPPGFVHNMMCFAFHNSNYVSDTTFRI